MSMFQRKTYKQTLSMEEVAIKDSFVLFKYTPIFSWTGRGSDTVALRAINLGLPLHILEIELKLQDVLSYS